MLVRNLVGWSGTDANYKAGQIIDIPPVMAAARILAGLAELVEHGSLSVTDGSTTVNNATSLSFTGATVTNPGSGVAGVTISGGGGSGPVLIDSGVISSSVPWIKYPSAGIALPSGYLWFELMVAGIGFSGFSSSYEGLAFAVSDSAGATFLNDTSNADSYLTYFAPGTPDMLGVLSDYFSPNSFGALVRATIYPGSVNKMFSVISHFAGLKDSNIVGSQPCITTPNPNATTPPVASRINMIRVKAYDSGDASDTTPAHGVDKAIWSLMGVPAPA